MTVAPEPCCSRLPHVSSWSSSRPFQARCHGCAPAQQRAGEVVVDHRWCHAGPGVDVGWWHVLLQLGVTLVGLDPRLRSRGQQQRGDVKGASGRPKLVLSAHSVVYVRQTVWPMALHTVLPAAITAMAAPGASRALLLAACTCWHAQLLASCIHACTHVPPTCVSCCICCSMAVMCC